MGASGPLPQHRVPEKVVRLKADTGNLRGVSKGSPRTKMVRARSLAPSMPDGLDEETQVEYRRVVAELEPLGVLSPADFGVLQSYLEAFQLRAEAWRILGVDGVTAVGQKGDVVKHAAFQVWDRCTNQIESAAKQLGLTPDRRLRMPVPELDDDDDDLD